MTVESKTRLELVKQLEELRRRNAELEASEADRKRAEAKLKESEERWRSLVRNAPSIIMVTDRDGTIRFINRTVQGLSAEEVIGRSVRGYTLPEHVETAMEAIEKVCRTGEVVTYEVSGTGPGGGTAHYSTRVGPIGGGNEAVAVMHIISDITDRKRVEEERKALLQHLGERVKEQTCLYSLARLLGESGAPLDDMLQEAAAIVAGAWQYAETTCVRIAIDGREQRTENFVDCLWKQTCEITVNGEHAGVIEVAYTDERPEADEGPFLKEERTLIHAVAGLLGQYVERKRAGEALQQKVRELDSFINNIPDMAWLKDGNSNFIAANKAFGAAVGMDPAYLVNHTCAVCFGEEAAAKFKEDDRKVMGSRQQTRIEESIKDARGNRVHLETIKSPISSETGEVVGTVGVARDITERKRAEEKLKAQEAELRRSNAELERFAYIASHDLQEPLRMVASFLQLLERHCGDKLDAEAHEFITFAVDGAKRMQSLINDLLVYSRAGTRGKPFGAVDCEAVLDRALDNLLVAVSESGAAITHDPLPTVMGDDTQLVQLFQNLIENAIKFRGPEAPRVHVAVERRGNDWHLCVRDNGIGVEPQYFKRIFAVFQRLHGRDEYPGTGIGLAVCKRIVERHKGTIGIKSEPGKGTTFHFTIPCRVSSRREPQDRSTGRTTECPDAARLSSPKSTRPVTGEGKRS